MYITFTHSNCRHEQNFLLAFSCFWNPCILSTQLICKWVKLLNELLLVIITFLWEKKKSGTSNQVSTFEVGGKRKRKEGYHYVELAVWKVFFLSWRVKANKSGRKSSFHAWTKSLEKWLLLHYCFLVRKKNHLSEKIGKVSSLTCC